MPIRNVGYLNGIEFKALREELGLTQSELMRILGIKNYQTIVRWEKGERFISTQVCDKIVALFKKAAARIGAEYDAIIERYKRFQYADFVLVLYPDKPERNAALRKAFCRFLAEGKKAHLIRFDPEDYDAYLTKKRLPDSEKNREEWALSYWKKKYYIAPPEDEIVSIGLPYDKI